MPYSGGFGTYRRHCDEIARTGYPGLVLTTHTVDTHDTGGH